VTTRRRPSRCAPWSGGSCSPPRWSWRGSPWREPLLREGAVNKGFVVQYVLKFLGLIGIVYLVVRSGWFDVLGFLLGLTSLFLGVLLEAVARSFRPSE
jgi:hypothetical protein